MHSRSDPADPAVISDLTQGEHWWVEVPFAPLGGVPPAVRAQLEEALEVASNALVVASAVNSAALRAMQELPPSLQVRTSPIVMFPLSWYDHLTVRELPPSLQAEVEHSKSGELLGPALAADLAALCSAARAASASAQLQDAASRLSEMHPEHHRESVTAAAGADKALYLSQADDELAETTDAVEIWRRYIRIPAVNFLSKSLLFTPEVNQVPR